MEHVRAPAVAGAFYPADPATLREKVAGMLAAVSEQETARPAGLIVPHAGYVYSGPVAASGYALLGRHASEIDRVLLIGPSHHEWVDGAVLPGARALATPLGDVLCDRDGERTALEQPSVAVSPGAHSREHSLEVQLPFLQVVLGEFSVVALLTGSEQYREIARVIGEFLGSPKTLVVVSSDLSHYLHDRAARERDERTARAIEELRPDSIGREDACGRVAVQAILEAARTAGLAPRRLDLRNSSDTAGPPDRVVGYGTWAFT